MERFSAFVTDHRAPIVGVALVLALLSGIAALFVPINYDLTSYLPESAESTRALEEMDAEFDAAVPNARVMVNGVDVEQALAFKQQLADAPGIEGVLWLDDVVDLGTPLEMLDPAAVDQYYRDGHALFDVTVANGQETEALQAIYDIVGEDGNATAEIAVAVKSEALNPRTSRIHYQLLTPTGENAAAGQKDVTLDMRREDTLRFLARIPANLLWSAELPTQYTLRLKTQHEGRYVEYLELRLGFRSVEMQDGRMSLNARPVTLRVREVPAAITENEIAALREQGFNTLKLLPGPVPESLLNFCDVQGLYVIAQAPIDTRRSGESRRKGGNPSNDPEWQPAYLERTENSYHTTKRHPSVVAFALATQSANGINLYESYLNMKRFGDSRPFIYPDAGGEWDSDKLALE